jgi:hypothetical protein
MARSALPRGLAATFLFVLALAGGFRCKPAERSWSPQELLVDQWRLTRLGNSPIRSSSISDWTLTFSANGTWRYAGRMGGLWSGTRMRGAGTWSLKGRTLQLTVNNTVHTAIVQVSLDELILTPDPVLGSPGTGTPVVAIYERLSLPWV